MLKTYLLGAWLLGAAGAAPALAQVLDPGFVPPASLYSVGYVSVLGPAQADGKRLVGCGAQRINNQPVSSHLVRLDATGALDLPFLQNVGAAPAPQRIRQLANGQYLLLGQGGTAAAGGLTRNELLRLNADGTADPGFTISRGAQQGSGPAGVSDFAPLADGRVLLAGSFSTIGGQSARCLVRLGSTGSVDATFSVGTGPSGGRYQEAGITSLAVQPDGKILAGGAFSQFNGQPASVLVRLNPDGSPDPTFASPLAPNDEVSHLLLQPDGTILVAGILHQGGRATSLVRLLPTGGFDPGFTLSPALGNSIGTNTGEAPMLLQPDGRLVVVGRFDLPGYRRVARLTPDGELDPTFQSLLGPDQLPNTLGLQPGGRVLVGGQFALGSAETALTQLTGSGAVDASYAPRFQLDGQLKTLVQQPDGSLLVGGDFNEWNGQPVHRVVRLSADGVLDASYGAGSLAFSLSVRTLLAQADGKVVVGADDGLLRLQADGSPEPAFALSAPAMTSVQSLAQQPDGKLLVLGAPVGSSLSRLLRLTSTGAPDASFTPPVLPALTVPTALLLQQDGRIVLGTYYLGATSRVTLQRFETTGTPDASFTAPLFDSSGFSPFIELLRQQPDGKLLVAGDFTRVGTATQHNLARLTTGGALDASFAPGTLLPLYSSVYALAIQPNGRLLAGGSFTLNTGGATYNNLLRLSSAGQLDASFAATANPSNAVTDVLVQADGRILLAGYFDVVAGQARRQLARLTAANVLPVQAPAPAAVATATSAWPVPAHDLLHLRPAPTAHPRQAELRDALGRVVQQCPLSGPAEVSLDVRGLPPGLYVLRLVYQEGTVSRPICLE